MSASNVPIRIIASICLCVLALPAFALPSVAVMADSSISPAVIALAREYSRQYNVVVNTAFLPRDQQQEQINEGGAGDVLITNDIEWIATLKTQGVVDLRSHITFAHGQLALVAPEDSSLQVDLTKKFPTADIIRAMHFEQAFVVANPETLPEGGASKEALRKIGAADYLEEYTLYIKSLPQMADLVARHNNYGTMLYSAAQKYEGVKVLDIFPQTGHKPVVYDAVVIAGDNMEAAREFLKFLQSNRAAAIFKRYGLASAE